MNDRAKFNVALADVAIAALDVSERLADAQITRSNPALAVALLHFARKSLTGWTPDECAAYEACGDAQSIVQLALDDDDRNPTTLPMDMAPQDGSWVLAFAPDRAERYGGGWLPVAWGEYNNVGATHWHDAEGESVNVDRWRPMPDPQPPKTGWTKAEGAIVVEEITGEGWTINGKPVEVPWRWAVYIERLDGSYDEYRDTSHLVTVDQARARAAQWHENLALPIREVPLPNKVIRLPEIRR